jgi:ABC-type uncharacterized transport system involved in gliding motility auxiliary subunit
VLDPLPFSEAEDRATAFGLRGAAIGPLGESVYFGLAASNSVGDQAIVPFFDPAQEAFLEYELARLVTGLTERTRPVVGLLAGLPVEGGFDPMSRAVSSPWVVVEQARQFYEMRTLARSVEHIDGDIDILWLLHPKALGEGTLYAIDQFLLRGGRVLAWSTPIRSSMSAGPDGSGGLRARTRLLAQPAAGGLGGARARGRGGPR